MSYIYNKYFVWCFLHVISQFMSNELLLFALWCYCFNWSFHEKTFRHVDAERYSAARNKVILAMKSDPNYAYRFAFIVDKGAMSTKKKATDPDAQILPNCANKYGLLGQDRIKEIIMFSQPGMSRALLDLMKLEDLKTLISYGHLKHIMEPLFLRLDIL